MASEETVEILAGFLNFAHKFKTVPFISSRNPINVEIRISLAYKFVTFFSNLAYIIVSIFLVSNNIFFDAANAEGMVLASGLISSFGVCQGSQVWMILKLESFMSLINTFLKFNRSLRKFRTQ